MNQPPKQDQPNAGKTGPQPNTLRMGRTARTMWPPGAGTKKWQSRFGEALLCVRHREDPAGLRRIITVELIVGTVAKRPGQHRIKPAALYPLKLHARERRLINALKALGGQWQPEDQCWYATGSAIQALQLEDRIAMRSKRQRTRPSAPV